ncbi:hypothetical protein [Streptomyces lydicus]|uniref:hypothetical protein n=1 Tax=Streptomyces lydicus TaxID=47763 RepID=UPI0019D7178F|nr:hypothetical protein [Streptomyces lydicus]MCZ1012291.1 hypothetical protein [Streptomyces lydicus]
MAESGNVAATWAERMELLKDTAQDRVLNAPMPNAAMEQLISDGKALTLGRFDASPVHYLDRWWRPSEEGWMALGEDASAKLDLHAERYRAATAAVGNPIEQAPGSDGAMPARPGAGTA